MYVRISEDAILRDVAEAQPDAAPAPAAGVEAVDAKVGRLESVVLQLAASHCVTACLVKGQLESRTGCHSGLDTPGGCLTCIASCVNVAQGSLYGPNRKVSHIRCVAERQACLERAMLESAWHNRDNRDYSEHTDYGRELELAQRCGQAAACAKFL